MIRKVKLYKILSISATLPIHSLFVIRRYTVGKIFSNNHNYILPQVSVFFTMSNKQCWGKVSWKKLKERDAQIPCGYVLSGEILDELDKLPNITFISQSENFFTPEEIDIINADAPEIISKTSSGIWTIVEITKAFIKAAMIVHQSVCDPLAPPYSGSEPTKLIAHSVD